MKRRRAYQARGAFEWIEEATHLLRTSPLSVLAAYYIGALPFVLGLLFFWADMSRSPFARRHVVEAALGVTLLFLWMKTWQAIFCLRLRALVAGEAQERLGFRRVVRIFAAQTAIQPAGLLLIPLALVITLPFAWVFAFYQNATALAEPGAAEGQSLARRAARDTRFWTGQYHVILLVLSVFALFIFLNWVAVGFLLPSLLKTLLGIETTFSRSSAAMFNTTFFATMAALTYLSVDPIVKALHVLRCFRGEAQTTGDDLKSELRHAVQSGARMAAVLLTGWFLLHSGACACAAASALPSPLNHNLTLNLNPPVPEGIKSKITIKIKNPGDANVLNATAPVPTPSLTPVAVPPQQLDETIEDVINQQKYTWRMPREKMAREESGEEGAVSRFFTKAGNMIREWLKAADQWLDKFFRRQPRSSPTGGAPVNWGGMAAGFRLLLYLLIVALVLALAWLIWRTWRNRRRGPEAIEATPIQPLPDVADENVGAEQLPEDEWTKLARELLARGEFRLALRAYYLSSLAFLGERRLITLARFKSNRDYERELARRGHALGDLPAFFGENVNTFDRVWYGSHAVDAEAVGRFASNVEKIRATA